MKKIFLVCLTTLLCCAPLLAKEYKMDPKKYDALSREEKLSVSLGFYCRDGQIPKEVQITSAEGPFHQSMQLFNMTLIDGKEVLYKPYGKGPELWVGELEESLVLTPEQQEACSKNTFVNISMRNVVLSPDFGVYVGVKKVDCFYNTAEDGIPFSGIKNAISYSIFMVDEVNKKVYSKVDYKEYDYKNGKCVNAKTILNGTGRVLLSPFLFLGWIIIGMP